MTTNFSSTLIAQYYGQKDYKNCVRTAWSGFGFALMTSVCFILLLPLGYFILKYRMDPELFPHGWDYFKGLLPSGFFACLA